MKVFSDTLYADVALDAVGNLPMDAAHEERALYTVSGDVEIAGVRFPAGQLPPSERRFAATFVGQKEWVEPMSTGTEKKWFLGAFSITDRTSCDKEKGLLTALAVHLG